MVGDWPANYVGDWRAPRSKRVLCGLTFETFNLVHPVGARGVVDPAGGGPLEGLAE